MVRRASPEPSTAGIWRRMCLLIWFFSVIILVLVALGLTALRLGVLVAPEFRTQLESRISAALERPLTLGSVHLAWRGSDLRLVLQDVRLAADAGWQPGNSDSPASALVVREMRLDLDLLRSLRERRFALTELTLTGVQLVVQRDLSGRLRFLGTEEAKATDINFSILEEVLQQPFSFHLSDARILISDHARQSIQMLDAVDWHLMALPEGGRQLAGHVHLPPAWGEALALSVVWAREGVRPLQDDVIEIFAELRGLKPEATEALFGGGVQSSVQASGNMRLWGDIRGGLPWLAGAPADGRHTGTLSLQLNAGELALPNLFRGPIPIDTLAAEARWRLDAEGWRFDLNDTEVHNELGRIRARTTLARQQQEPLFVDLQANLQGKAGNGQHTSRYLPVGILYQGLVDWLDRGIGGGTAEEVDVVFYGHAADFPFADESGRFEVQGRVSGVTLNYLSDWPALRDLDANLHFLGQSMRINARDGSIHGVRLLEAEAFMPELRTAPLRIRGRMRGPGDAMLGFLGTMPLTGATLTQVLAATHLDGEHGLALDLEVPFDGRPVGVAGQVTLDSGDFQVPAWGLTLKALDGTVDFDRTGIRHAAVRGRLDGAPLMLSANTIETSGGQRTRLHADAVQVPLSVLHRYVPRTEFLSGAGNLEFIAELPGFSGDMAPDYPVTLAFHSDLVGVDNSMPAPLGKAAEDDLPLSVEFGVGERIGPVHIRYGHLATMVLTLAEEGGGVDRMGVRLGRQADDLLPPPLPPGAGMALTGNTAELDVDGWLAWAPERQVSSVADQQALVMRWLDITVGSLRLGGIDWPDLDVFGRRAGDWDFSLEGPTAAGTLFVPMASVTDQPLRLNLRHLRLPPSMLAINTAGGNGRTNPAFLPLPPEFAAAPGDLPAIDGVVHRLLAQDRELGTLRFSGEHDENGNYQLHALHLDGTDHALEASGSWQSQGTAMRTDVRFSLRSENVGRVLAAWGYPDTMQDGRGRFRGSLSWPADPFNLVPEALSGTLRLSLRDGQLLQVNPGAGRLFGLLSVAMLPRRLMLDFSDVIEEGFAFDRLVAEFSLDTGRAQPRELYLDGPAAHVSAEGAIDLGTQTYDQIVSIVPKASSTLPLLAGLFGGPPGAAAMLLAQQLFPGVDGVARQEYRVTGPWEDPHIERLSRSTVSPVREPAPGELGP